MTGGRQRSVGGCTVLWRAAAPAAAPGTDDLAVGFPPVEERCEEVMLVVVYKLNAIGESYVLALANACHILNNALLSSCCRQFAKRLARYSAIESFSIGSHLQSYDLLIDISKQIAVETNVLLEYVQPALKQQFLVQGTMIVFYRTLHETDSQFTMTAVPQCCA